MRIRWTSDRPWDLWAVAGLVALSALAVVLDAPGWLRVPLGLAFVLVAPGYAFVAALFPERHWKASDEDQEGSATARGKAGKKEPALVAAGRRGLEPLERAALSLGLSIAIVPLLGLALNFTPWGIRLAPVLLTIAAFTLACLGAAWWRRKRLPADERFTLALTVETPAWSSQRNLDKALTIGLALAVVLATGTLFYVLATPRPGEAFTEFYILGPTGKASCYPSTFRDGAYRLPDPGSDCPLASGNVTVGIVNHEGRDVTYHLRVVWTRETVLPGNTTRIDQVQVASESNVTLQSVAVDASSSDAFRPQYSAPYALPPPPFNGTLRLSFQLYTTAPPPVSTDTAFLDSPYRHLHLWVDVA